jgi:hypothetical protein
MGLDGNVQKSFPMKQDEGRVSALAFSMDGGTLALGTGVALIHTKKGDDANAEPGFPRRMAKVVAVQVRLAPVPPRSFGDHGRSVRSVLLVCRASIARIAGHRHLPGAETVFDSAGRKAVCLHVVYHGVLFGRNARVLVLCTLD